MASLIRLIVEFAHCVDELAHPANPHAAEVLELCSCMQNDMCFQESCLQRCYYQAWFVIHMVVVYGLGRLGYDFNWGRHENNRK